MKMSENGLHLLEMREGSRTLAYKDTKGIWTIGVGHTGPEVKEGLRWTPAQIDEAFRKDVEWAEDAVNKVKVPLTQYQFDALVSFVFNVGAGAFERSTMLKCLNKGDFHQACLEFDKWVKPPEIKSRRMSEKNQFAGT